MPRPILVPLIVALNIGVFAFWSLAEPEQLKLLMDNFLVSWIGVSEGRWWTVLTSVFSHNLLIHILINMFVLNSFGSLVEQILGRAQFLMFYLTAGIVSSLTHIFVSAFFLNQPEVAALGASGAIAGLVLVFALMFPKEKILLFGLIPLPALVGALAFVAIDIFGLIAQSRGGGLPIGHGAHLGGALTGFLYFMFYLRSRLQDEDTP